MRAWTSVATTNGMHKAAKVCVFLLCLTPFAWLVTRTLTGRLGINPVEDLELTTGIWALRFLVLTLAVTPIRRLTGWNRIIQYRRMLGLFAFFYVCAHFVIYVAVDQFFAWSLIVKDVAKRPFITMGFTAFVLMIPLALTSTKGWIRRLGRKWQMLHRLIYISGACAAIHYLWKVKVMIGSPVYYAAIIAILLTFRVVWLLLAAKPFKTQRVTARSAVL
jgi:methionine sulfoxide reductase heme-binding subunit